MTEQEWLSGTDPTPMLEALRGKTSDRKLRLFACACCHRVWDSLSEERSRSLMLVAEQFADGVADADELQRAFELASAAHENIWAKGGDLHASGAVLGLQQCLDLGCVTNRVCSSITLGDEVLCDERLYAVYDSKEGFNQLIGRLEADEWRAQAQMAHCVFGNPFRPVTAIHAWLTPDVVALATGIYADRAFDRMPILADALQDAGCDNADILTHCRSEAPHVRGCWVVDLLLGKA